MTRHKSSKLITQFAMWSVIASHKIRTTLLSQERNEATQYSGPAGVPHHPHLQLETRRMRSPWQKCRQTKAPLPPQPRVRCSKAELCSQTASGSTEHRKRRWARGAAWTCRGQPGPSCSRPPGLNYTALRSVKVFDFMQVIFPCLPLNDGWDSHRSSALLKEITIISEASQ